MSALAAQDFTPEDDLDLAVERWAAMTIARAILAFNGEIGWLAAVDRSWSDAVADGLVSEFGVDEVQRAMALAFEADR